MTYSPAATPTPVRPTLGRVAAFGIGAAIAAAVVVALVAYLIGQVFDIDPDFQPFTPPAAAVVTVLYTLVGTAVLAVVCRVAAEPRKTFIQVAIAGLALSFVPQVLLLVTGFEVPMGEFTVKNVLALSSLHLVAAAVVLPVMLRVFRA